MFSQIDLCKIARETKFDIKSFFKHIESKHGLKLLKFNPDIEYEIKLEHNANDLKTTIKDISDKLENSGDFFALNCEAGSDYKVDFFTDNEVEYSIFLYNNKLMMKKKKHHIEKNALLTIFKSSETFEYDGNTIYNIVKQDNIIYMSNMRKIREKDFIINKNTGMVFASAITKCIAGEKIQKQYELE